MKGEVSACSGRSGRGRRGSRWTGPGRHLAVRGHRGILTYGLRELRLRLEGGTLRVEGEDLALEEMDAEDLRVTGASGACAWRNREGGNGLGLGAHPDFGFGSRRQAGRHRAGGAGAAARAVPGGVELDVRAGDMLRLRAALRGSGARVRVVKRYGALRARPGARGHAGAAGRLGVLRLVLSTARRTWSLP